MRALVTGGCGFIGSALVRHLVHEWHVPVVNLDVLTYAATLGSVQSAANEPNYSFVRGDICDRALLKRIFADHRPTCVFHLAAESHVDRSIEDPLLFVRTNVLGTATLLETALDHYG